MGGVAADRQPEEGCVSSLSFSASYRKGTLGSSANRRGRSMVIPCGVCRRVVAAFVAGWWRENCGRESPMTSGGALGASARRPCRPGADAEGSAGGDVTSDAARSTRLGARTVFAPAVGSVVKPLTLLGAGRTAFGTPQDARPAQGEYQTLENGLPDAESSPKWRESSRF